MGSCGVRVKCFQLGPWLSPGQHRALVNLSSMPSGGAGMARRCANYFSLATQRQLFLSLIGKFLLP